MMILISNKTCSVPLSVMSIRRFINLNKIMFLKIAFIFFSTSSTTIFNHKTFEKSVFYYFFFFFGLLIISTTKDIPFIIKLYSSYCKWVSCFNNSYCSFQKTKHYTLPPPTKKKNTCNNMYWKIIKIPLTFSRIYTYI